jgi:hypothetical protein
VYETRKGWDIAFTGCMSFMAVIMLRSLEDYIRSTSKVYGVLTTIARVVNILFVALFSTFSFDSHFLVHVYGKSAHLIT